MKYILNFVRITLTGGILFLLPIVLLIGLLSKADAIIVKIAEPLAQNVPDTVLGFEGRRLMAMGLLVLICFVSGLLFRWKLVKKLVSMLEDDLLSYLPGYSLLKSIVADSIGADVQYKMLPVLVQDGEAWNIGFLVEENERFCTVFFPEAPRHDSGEVKIVSASTVTKIDLPSNKVARSLKSFGKGSLTWVKDNKN